VPKIILTVGNVTTEVPPQPHKLLMKLNHTGLY